MAKKKRRKSSKGLGGIGKFFGAGFRVLARGLPVAGVVFLSGALFVGIRGLLFADAELGIQEIVVNPSTGLSITQRQDLESKVLGKNMLQVNLQDVARWLQRDPQIQTARVMRRFPSMLVVEVRSRAAVAWIRFSPHGPLRLVSEDGMIIDSLEKPNSPGVILEVFESGLKEPKVGMQVKSRGFREAMRFLKLFPSQPLAQKETITKMTLDHLGNVTMTLGTGPQIRLGRRPAERFEVLEKIAPLLDGAERDQLDYVDLQFDNVIVKRKR